jgi:hypothetical protein
VLVFIFFAVAAGHNGFLTPLGTANWLDTAADLRCARNFRAAGADLAIACLNTKPGETSARFCHGQRAGVCGGRLCRDAEGGPGRRHRLFAGSSRRHSRRSRVG